MFSVSQRVLITETVESDLQATKQPDSLLFYEKYSDCLHVASWWTGLVSRVYSASSPVKSGIGFRTACETEQDKADIRRSGWMHLFLSFSAGKPLLKLNIALYCYSAATSTTAQMFSSMFMELMLCDSARSFSSSHWKHSCHTIIIHRQSRPHLSKCLLWFTTLTHTTGPRMPHPIITALSPIWCVLSASFKKQLLLEGL